MSKPNSSTWPSDELVARVWHALSDETLDGTGFDSEDCTCRNYGPYARRVLEVFSGRPTAEPEGLGAVVVNPSTGEVWVRAAHPALSWHDPATSTPKDWCVPTSERWSTWAELEQLLAVQSAGWLLPQPAHTPETALAPPKGVLEPTGIGAVVVDAANDTWVRVHDGRHPWHLADPATGQVANWEDLPQPVQIQHLRLGPNVGAQIGRFLFPLVSRTWPEPLFTRLGPHAPHWVA